MNNKPAVQKLTELESVIMDAVWELGQATVREVQEHLWEARPMARNTVLTMMGILRDKGFLQSTREGRTDLYTPTVSREQVGGGLLRDMMQRFFSGSAHAMVSQLLDCGDLAPEEIKAIRKEINWRLKN
ncbi:MAG: Penicillinase repressor [Candidatus Hydrogenedentes bacterium ADurb.Bin101]|jgi:predicted transcriptional regulator|nr:MAG: Penicillinase repressor [Candidatus Hydrogenedentes bacterium ADurb.Bin101]